MFTTTDRDITAEQVRRAFKALGILEAHAPRDAAALGDAIAAVLHAAAREANRRQRRLDAARSHRLARQASRRGELVLVNDAADAALYAIVA
jgi:hypothetical protein